MDLWLIIVLAVIVLLLLWLLLANLGSIRRYMKIRRM
jgi:hypothetical protein